MLISVNCTNCYSAILLVAIDSMGQYLQVWNSTHCLGNSRQLWVTWSPDITWSPGVTWSSQVTWWLFNAVRYAEIQRERERELQMLYENDLITSISNVHFVFFPPKFGASISSLCVRWQSVYWSTLLITISRELNVLMQMLRYHFKSMYTTACTFYFALNKSRWLSLCSRLVLFLFSLSSMTFSIIFLVDVPPQSPSKTVISLL